MGLQAGQVGVSVVESTSPREVLKRAVAAMNAHDLDALVACFHPDYESIQPVHPRRNFRGREHVVQNWSWVFERFPDFRAEMLDCVVQGCRAWTEWQWSGTDTNGQSVDVRGVMIVDIEAGMIRYGRLYLESVSES